MCPLVFIEYQPFKDSFLNTEIQTIYWAQRTRFQIKELWNDMHGRTSGMTCLGSFRMPPLSFQTSLSEIWNLGLNENFKNIRGVCPLVFLSKIKKPY